MEEWKLANCSLKAAEAKFSLFSSSLLASMGKNTMHQVTVQVNNMYSYQFKLVEIAHRQMNWLSQKTRSLVSCPHLNALPLYIASLVIVLCEL